MARVILYYYSDVMRCAESRTEKLKRALSLVISSVHTFLLLLLPFSFMSVRKHTKFFQFEHKSTNKCLIII